jgi:hypothetical protein
MSLLITSINEAGGDLFLLPFFDHRYQRCLFLITGINDTGNNLPPALTLVTNLVQGLPFSLYILNKRWWDKQGPGEEDDS